jgi:8-oxo-dGTP pyrophosphatase MutT (NUDIX family)
MDRERLIRLFNERGELTATTVIPGTDEVLLGTVELNFEQMPRLPLRPASVLMALVDRPEGLSVLLTRRRDDLAHHAGQVSFPGGTAEPTDKSALDTALRETEEEIGLDRSRIEIIGRLGDYVTKSGFKIAPFVGLVEPPFELTPCPREVAEVFEVPLSFLLDTENHRLIERKNSVNAKTYEMTHGTYRIWGITAAMIVSFVELVGRP